MLNQEAKEIWLTTLKLEVPLINITVTFSSGGKDSNSGDVVEQRNPYAKCRMHLLQRRVIY
ncbi:hypothetical protein HanPSC8_Chr15g0678111 [Helianthus annuus]|uniref:Uncharacterized protein n=1 Tax=Helianthus annuus TaxID=4232 RepID=A0A251VKR5_HELAN|nr:hypothetical protein HanPSC8_Chr15g0678111 [Helianthus annuus]